MKTLLFDFARVILFSKDKSYTGKLNPLHQELSKDPNYSFLKNFEFNEKLLDFLAVNQDNFNLYIFTSGHIQNVPEVQKRIKSLFKAIYSAKDLGIKKDDPNAYKLIYKKINKNPREVVFIDDNLKYINAAKQAGLQTIQFKNSKQLLSQLNID